MINNSNKKNSTLTLKAIFTYFKPDTAYFRYNQMYKISIYLIAN